MGRSPAGSTAANIGSARRSTAADREHLLDRLHHLRSILPAMAQELASARRQAAALRVENRGLVEEVRQLRAQRDETGSARRGNGAPSRSGQSVSASR